MWNYTNVDQLTRTSPNYTIYKELFINFLNLWEITRHSKSRAPDFSRARSPRAGDFLCLLLQKRTRARWDLLPEPEMRSEWFWASLEGRLFISSQGGGRGVRKVWRNITLLHPPTKKLHMKILPPTPPPPTGNFQNAPPNQHLIDQVSSSILGHWFQKL